MARNEQLIRQHRLLQILERTRFGRTLDELRGDLVEELGLGSLHTRSVRRDLEALQAAGFDVVSTETQRGRVWKLGPRHRTMHQITVSATELISLSLGRELLTPLMGTPFWQGIEAFWHKVKETLPSAVWNHYEKYRRILHVLGTPAKSYTKHHGTLKTLNRAILEHRVVEIQYQSLAEDRPRTRLIRPYALALYQSSIYIIAESGDQDAAGTIRHLKLDRFLKAVALDSWFTPNPQLDIERHLRESIGIFSSSRSQKFKIRLSARAARWVTEDPWHPEQQIKQQADGSVILTVPAAHDLDVIPRVLALGSEAELLSPASCRQAMRETVIKLLATYDP